MTYLDWIIIVALAAGLVRGMMAGAIRQVASIIGLVVSFILAVQLMRPIGALTADGLGLSEATAPLVGFVVVFGGVQLIIIALARMIEAAVESLNLTFANRAAGGALGAFKAALLLSVLFLVSTQAGIPDEETQQASMLYTPVAEVLPGTWDHVAAYLPAVRQASEAFGESVRPTLTPDDEEPPAPTDPKEQDADSDAEDTEPDGAAPGPATTGTPEDDTPGTSEQVAPE